MTALTDQVSLRYATPNDAPAISNLIVTVARAQLRGEFTQEGWEMFLRLISKQTQRGIIDDMDFVYWLATVSDNSGTEKIVGLLCSKQRFHVFHFFILPDYQCQGIGTRLWRNYLMHIPNQHGLKITVNASDFALDFYKQLGFRVSGQRQIKNGLVHTPMQFYLAGL